jgi:hypothetical protein
MVKSNVVRLAVPADAPRSRFRVYKTSQAGNVRAKRVYEGSAINAGR